MCVVFFVRNSLELAIKNETKKQERIYTILEGLKSKRIKMTEHFDEATAELHKYRVGENGKMCK